MAEHRLTITRSARRELEALDPTIGRRVVAKIASLATDPRPAGCVKLTGSTNLWRV